MGWKLGFEDSSPACEASSGTCSQSGLALSECLMLQWLLQSNPVEVDFLFPLEP